MELLGAGYQTGGANGQHRYVWLQIYWLKYLIYNCMYTRSRPFYGIVLYILLYIQLEGGF